MRATTTALASAFVLLAPAIPAKDIDGRVVRVRMPVADITLMYVETSGGMVAELRSGPASVSGQRFYIGDGEVALELAVIPKRGIVLQGTTELDQGFVFKREMDLQVLPGYKKASDLRPGDVYVTLPAVGFKLPPK